MIVNIVLESQDICHFVVMVARSVCLRVAQRGYFVLLKIHKLNHLSRLESEAIEIMREVVSETEIQLCCILLVKTVR